MLEYANCISVERQYLPNECPEYDIKPFDA